MKLIAALCRVITLSSALWSGSVLSCPLNRVIDAEQNSGAALTFVSVAVDTQLECSDGVSRHEMPADGDPVICQGPYGDTFIKATLEGNKRPIFIAYRVIHGSPCCFFESSYNLNDLTSATLTWDDPKSVPDVDRDSWIVNVATDLPPWPADTGPLAGRNFTFASCRAD